jgi:ribosomal protein S18 acetylase RimI-like enzyme
MNVRMLCSDDWELLRDIRLTSLKSDPQAFGGSFDEELTRPEAEWRKRLENPNRFYFAIEENGVLVSLAGSLIDEEGNWLLVAVYTLPSARGKGYAQKVILNVIEEMRRRGATEIQLMVNADQADAVKVYEKFGFKILKTNEGEKMGDGQFHKAYKMIKKLA